MLRFELTPAQLACRGPFAGRAIAWDEVQWMRVSRMEGERPAGRLRLQGARAAIALTLPPKAWRRTGRFIFARCPRAFLIDDDTGQVVPPRAGSHVEVRDRAAALAGRVVRRYLLMGFAGTLLVGGLAALGVLVFLRGQEQRRRATGLWQLLVGGVIASGAWAVHSFARARSARRSLDRIIDAGAA